MKKKRLKRETLKLIKKLEHKSTIYSPVASCWFMPEDFREFLVKNKILKDPVNSSIWYELFDAKLDTLIPANLFRMMVITEYCKQKGIKL
jgi:hypothetical protein